MVILLDIGNTNIKIGAVIDGKIVRTWRLATDHKKTADEYGMVFLDLLASNGFTFNDVEGLITREFNLMMKTFVGPVFDDDHVAYLRAETCQPIFVDFHSVRIATRQKVPFGIAQIGKAFRNEINPRNFTFRSREFTQMEMEFFCDGEEGMEWFEYWKE